jgi:methylated-DNA-[protein]-cysteine S-methyltransferase
MPAAVAWTTVAAPWGPIHLAASDRGLVAVEIMAPPDGFVARLERRFGAVEGDGSGLAGVAARQIEAFLAGERRAFDLPIDLADRPDWDRAVLGGVATVPWGATASYGEIASRIGRPGAARAVGGAVGRNPVALIVPCHRVIASDGSIGGYGGDWDGSREEKIRLKRDLLAREGVVVG